MIDIQAIARHYGGQVSGGQALIPAIGHSSADRGVAIKPDADAPDGCLVHCFNNGDPLAEKNRLRADGFLPARAGSTRNEWMPTAEFIYTDAEGRPLYRTVRQESRKRDGKGKREKRFFAQHRKGCQWVSSIKGIERVPYKLPQLRKAIDEGKLVFFVEGEAKADKLAGWGLAATAVAFGCNGWRQEYLQHFAGAKVIILPDNDAAGRMFAQTVYNDLRTCASAKIVNLPRLPEAGDIIDWDGNADELLRYAIEPARPGLTQTVTPANTSSLAFTFTAIGELEYRAPKFLVHRLIETDSTGVLFGAPGVAKSFVAVDIGLSVATGTAFHGHEVRQGPVIMVAGEGHNGLTRRVAAWAAQKGVNLDGVPFYLSNRAAQFLDAKNAEMVKQAVKMVADDVGAPALIMVDTLARNFGPGDENSNSAMTAFVAALDALRAEFPESTVLIVHHSGHGDKGRARGGMALKGALDFEYRVEKDDAVIQLINTKMKDAEQPGPLAFSLEVVELAKGGTSAVLVEADIPSRQDRVGGAQALGRDAFIEAAQKCGGTLTVDLNAWRDVFLSRYAGDNLESKKRVFRRVREDLVKAGVLDVMGDRYAAKCQSVIDEITVDEDWSDFSFSEH